MAGTKPEAVTLGEEISEDDLLIHDEKQAEPCLAYLLSRMRYPDSPEPRGVFRCVERPTYDDLIVVQMHEAVRTSGEGTLETLCDAGETWIVR